MKVTKISTHQAGKFTTFSADFIFSHPYGGKKSKLKLWVNRFFQIFRNPLGTLRHGFSIRRNVWYTVPTQFATKTDMNDAFFLAALPLAIATNEDLIFDGEISLDLATNYRRVEQYYSEISQRNIMVTTRISLEKKKANTRVGQFFTLGVDSFYSLLCNPKKGKSDTDYLIYIDGYDTPFFLKRFLSGVHQKIEAVAKHTKKKTLFMSSNIRQLSDPIIGWGRFHVSALVAAGSLIGFKKLYISGESFEAADWGLRFGADTLFSNKHLEIEMVAHSVSREEKVRQLLKSPSAELFLRFIRVCWENVRRSDLPYNCSVCQKCLKTRLNLLSLGVENPPTFLPINIQALEKVILIGHTYNDWHDIYVSVNKMKKVDPAILAAVEKIMKKPLCV